MRRSFCQWLRAVEKRRHGGWHDQAQRRLLAAMGQMTDVNGTLFFMANGDAEGAELWKSDGTVAGTTMVRYILPGPDGSLPAELTSVNGLCLLCRQRRPARGRAMAERRHRQRHRARGRHHPRPGKLEHHRADECEWNLVLRPVAAERPAEPGAVEERWHHEWHRQGHAFVSGWAAKGAVRLQRTAAVYRRQRQRLPSALWRSDGTAQGTRSFQEIMPESQPYAPIYPTVSGSSLFFNVYTSALSASCGLSGSVPVLLTRASVRPSRSEACRVAKWISRRRLPKCRAYGSAGHDRERDAVHAPDVCWRHIGYCADRQRHDAHDGYRMPGCWMVVTSRQGAPATGALGTLPDHAACVDHREWMPGQPISY